MTHSEIKAICEKKIAEAVSAIKNAKNGELLTINTSLSYIDDSFVEKSGYNGKDNTSIVVSAQIYAKGHEGEEEPSYEISLLCDLKNGEARNPAEFVTELENFEKELERFISELSSADDVRELIRKEDERISLEGEKMAERLQTTLKKMKKVGFIGAIILVAILLALTLVK